MTSINEYYKSESDYIKASDLQPGKKYPMIISGLSETKFGEGDKNKLALSFSNAEKKLVLNKTNATTIAHVLGDTPENWMGSKIFIYSTKVSYGDNMVDAVRVEMPLEEVAMEASGPDTEMPAMIETTQQSAPGPSSFGNFDEDLPF